jgi:hypothetical protein
MVPDPSSEPASSAGSPVGFERHERLLRELPNVELIGLLRHSSNYTYLVRVSDASESLLAVYKPAVGESPLWDFPPASLYRREVAAYVLSRALGWPLIPATVIRDEAPEGKGSLQLFIDADPRNHFLRTRDAGRDMWPRVAVFDIVTNNADRKAGHLVRDDEGRIWAFDHGLTFHPQEKLRTVIWDYAGRPLPVELRPALEQVAARLDGELGAELRELLTRAEMRSLKRRAEDVLQPNWCFPYPTSNWSLPWPPI